MARYEAAWHASQLTPGAIMPSTTRTASSTAPYTRRCAGVNTPPAGKLLVMSAP